MERRHRGKVEISCPVAIPSVLAAFGKPDGFAYRKGSRGL